ncbi:TraG/VirB4 family ATPase [Prevotella sp.]|jgi:type IV secretory pathway VirB4 component|uniref:TraG/VirB4 family ATPase n=1 Tax=Prevotella sp. TaxID=59823 RepID=UPI004026F830
MVVIIVILVFVSILSGMALSIWAFGTGSKRAKIFEDIYFSVEDVENKGIIYTKKGDYSAVLEMENPIKKYSADTDSYYDFTTLMASVIQVLGEGYALHKQDVFVRKNFDMSRVAAKKKKGSKKAFLSEAYFRFFNGREYTEATTYLVITQKGKKGGIHTYDNSKWRDFLVKIQKVFDRLKSGEVNCRFLTAAECKEYADRFFAFDFKNKNISMTDFKVDSEKIGMGNKQIKVYSLLDVDSIGLPGNIRPYTDVSVNNAVISQDLLADIDHVPGVDSIVYNQVIFLPNQKREMMKLDKKKNRHASIPNPNNQIAVEDINAVQNELARNGKILVYAHYNLIVQTSSDYDFQKVTNSLENIFARYNIHISKRAYNQLELFVASFPGNCFRLNQDYDQFLTLSEAALCLMYKERQAVGDDSALKCYYTDRQGLPLAVDTSGKEGKKRYTNNSNFFVLGPSGSGKSFFMNTVMRQYREQDTDIVIIDTGDSYEGLCSYFDGTYISYSKEKPISMNPFKVTDAEYNENFGEKKNFLKSLIFQLFKGAEFPTKLEDAVINQTIVEYYEEYFHPFEGFNEEERKEMKTKLLLEDKKNGEYDKFEEELEERYGDEYEIEELEYKKLSDRDKRISEKLKAVIEDKAATEGEKEVAQRALQRLTPEVIENKYLMRIEHQIDKIERQKKKLKVTELSFNSYYEFAVERIPQIMKQQNIQFNIHDFATILQAFYKGGENESILNNDIDGSLFDEKFIVFEIDKVKDDPVLFPILTLIIMDVFTQKMRIKKGRKCLVIEEAWKAIATPVMADYIKYLYKTARKHWAMVGVVTQEIQDITSSPIVKEAIINNSDVFMLLDQSKFKDKFDDIKATLSLTDIDCKKIFTINRLDNHEGRSRFQEVFIKRGQDGEVYGVEEPPECYINYTTEKVEKEAFKFYRKQLKGNYQHGIEVFVKDWKDSGLDCTSFAKLVMKEGKMYNQMNKK